MKTYWIELVNGLNEMLEADSFSVDSQGGSRFIDHGVLVAFYSGRYVLSIVEQEDDDDEDDEDDDV